MKRTTQWGPRMLYRGQLSDDALAALMEQTRVTSEPVSQALHDYLVKGLNKAAVEVVRGVSLNNLDRALAALERRAQQSLRVAEAMNWTKQGNE